jgi:hypothetical protein
MAKMTIAENDLGRLAHLGPEVSLTNTQPSRRWMR